MAIAVSGKGGIMVRVDPTATPKLVQKAGVERMEMAGRRMDGWVRVDAEQVRTTRQLTAWIDRGTAVARALPPKKAPARR